MMFVDGENFTIRAQELARREGLKLSTDPVHYLQDVFVWMPTWEPVRTPFLLRLFPLENDLGTRAYYYTSVVGDDDKVVAVRRSLRARGFDPLVFKKPSGAAKSKGVDITLTKDMLSHAFQDHYEDAVLIAGDADYIPLIEEVKRRGKRVFVAFFAGEGLGLAQEVQLIADHFVDLGDLFLEAWRGQIKALEQAKGTAD